MSNWTHDQIYGMTFLILRLGCMAFMAILFLQSGFDKVTDWKGNLGWLKGHFAKTALKGIVPALLGLIMVMEVATGLLSAGGFLQTFIKRPLLSEFAFMANILALVNLLFLFMGQRIAKDYTGAAGIVPYFIFAVISLLIQAAATGA
jgi:hypothetical protein